MPAFSWKAERRRGSRPRCAPRTRRCRSARRAGRRGRCAVRRSAGTSRSWWSAAAAARRCARWAAARSAYGCERRPSASVTAAARARTAGSWVSGGPDREDRSARLAASSAAMESVPWARPRARVTISRGLLPGEGEPAGDLRVDVALGGGVQRDVQQRAGGGDVDPVGEAEQGAQRGQRLLEVVDPDVAAVDDAGHQPLAGQPADRRQVAEVGGRGAGEVQRQAVDGRLGQYRQRVAQPVEVGGDQQLRAVGERAEIAVGAGGGVQHGGGAVLDQRRFVQLHPVGAGRPQIGEHLGVDGQQPVQQRQRVEVGGDTGRGLGQQEVGDRPDEDRAGGESEREGFRQLGDLLGGVRGEDRVRPQLRDQIVVVGVEPLGHLQRRHVLGAARHREVAVQRRRRPTAARCRSGIAPTMTLVSRTWS